MSTVLVCDGSQVYGITQILSPSLIIGFCCGNLHEEFNLLQLAHCSCGWRRFTWWSCICTLVSFQGSGIPLEPDGSVEADRLRNAHPRRWTGCSSWPWWSLWHCCFHCKNVPNDQVLIWRGPSEGGTSETWYPRSIVKWWEFSWASLLLLNNFLAFQVVLVVKEGKGRVTKRRSRSCWSKASALTARFFLEWISCFLMHVFLGQLAKHISFLSRKLFGQSRTFCVGGGLFWSEEDFFRLEEDFFRSE